MYNCNNTSTRVCGIIMVYDIDYYNKCMLMVFFMKVTLYFGLINIISSYKVFFKKATCRESADNFLVGIIMGKK